MRRFFLYEKGVVLWESFELELNESCATITIVQRSMGDLQAFWGEVAVWIAGVMPNVIKWRSLGPVGLSKVLEAKVLKELVGELSGGDVIKKNERTGVFSYVKKVFGCVSDFDLESISQHRYTMLVFADDCSADLDRLWCSFQHLDVGVSSRGMAEVVESLSGVLMCRVVESDTHVVAQFVCEDLMADRLLGKIVSLGAERVSDKEFVGIVNS